MKIKPRGWDDFQHYKNRCPPWIRLHRSLIDNYDFQCLPVASRALAPMLWLLASESTDAEIDAEVKKLAFRLRQSEKEIASALKPLIDNGFFIVVQGDSSVLAERKQVAAKKCSETETETETETESEGESRGKRAKPAHKVPLPEDFGISQAVGLWAAAKGYDRLGEHMDAFRRKCKAKGYAYADWDAAFMEAVREDWAKLRGSSVRGQAPPPESVRNDDAERSQAYLREQAAHKAVPPPAEVLEKLRSVVRMVS